MKSISRYSLLLAVCITQALHTQAQHNSETAPDPTGTQYNVSLPHDYNQAGNSAPSLYNLTRTWVPIIPVTDSTGFSMAASGYYHISTTYTNGWGSPLQSITRGISVGKDLGVAYDNRASTQKLSLPAYVLPGSSHFQVSPYTTGQNYYNSLYPGEGGANYGATENVAQNGTSYVHSYQPGLSFVGRGRGTTTYSYPAPASENIAVLNIDANGLPVAAGTYSDGQLMMKVTEGQHNAKSISYTDKGGQLICTKVWAPGSGNIDDYGYTYYAYDDLGRLRYIIPPLAAGSISQGLPLSQDVLDGLCYSYIYNDRGQEIAKHTPGKDGNEETVYDRLHRPVLVQTALLRGLGKWKFTIYDLRGRAAVTGLVTSTNSRDDWQNITRSTGATAGTLDDYLQNQLNGNYPTAVDAIPDCRIEQINYYDDYNNPVAAGKDFDFSYISNYRMGPDLVTPRPTRNTNGLLTASIVYIENPDKHMQRPYIQDIYYYDRHARLIQTQTMNPFEMTDWEVYSLQYNFKGQTVLSIAQYHAGVQRPKYTTRIDKRYNYDALASRLVSVEQQTDNDGNWIPIANYTYDDLGRVSHKKLGGIEDQFFEYNIRGQQTAMNHGFVDDPNCSQCATMHYGQTLHYDYGFDTHRYDGSIAGFIWRNMGGPGKRAYEYFYDEAGRINSASFSQYTGLFQPGGPTWNEDDADYSVYNISYDPNGNMQSMYQAGPYGTQSIVMDMLHYTYKPGSNQLDNITDDQPLNSNLGEFWDGHSGPGDYRYDGDGNMTADANKYIDSMRYNYRDQPDSIAGQAGKIRYLYAGDGTLLQKEITDQNNGNAVTTYRYWGPLVYRNDSLLYVLHDEGRMRWLEDSSKYKYDYFIKDHLGNVRSTVAMEMGTTHDYLATHEIASANLENTMFDALHRDAKPSSTSPQDTKANMLDGSQPDRRVGTALLLHVMAGDQFYVSAQHYYDVNTGDDNIAADAGSMMSSIISTLTGGAGGVIGSESHNTDLANTAFGADNYNVYDALKESMTDPHLPRAYLNYLVFDEAMHLVPEESGVVQVNAIGGSWQNMQLAADIILRHNGFLSIYLSNEQAHQVWFDNMDVTYYTGRLQEEQHYYPHGLAISMGSNAPLPNKYLYQGKELQDQLNVNLYDFGARQYDPAIGRFWGIDPADQFPSGYTGMANDPANNIDPTGMAAIGANGGTGGASFDNKMVMGGNPLVQDQFVWSSSLDEGTLEGAERSEARLEGSGGSASLSSEDNPGQGTQDDPTVVYTSQGVQVANIHDGSPNVLILNENNDGIGMGLSSLVDKYLGMGGSASDFTKVISQLGVTYDIKGMENFFDKYGESESVTKFANSVPVGPWYGATLDGMPISIHSEMIAHLVSSDGKFVTVGSQVAPPSHDAFRSDPGKIPDEPNVKGIVHTHDIPKDGKIEYWVKFGNARFHDGSAYPVTDRPSPMDHSTAPRNGYRDAVVSPTHIYLYTPYNKITINRH